MGDRKIPAKEQATLEGFDFQASPKLSAAQADDLYELITERAGRSVILTSNRAPAKAHMFVATCARRRRNLTGPAGSSAETTRGRRSAPAGGASRPSGAEQHP